MSNLVYKILGIAWCGINVYLVCGNTMCVSTWQVELFVENCLSLFYCRGVDNRRFGRLFSFEKNCPAY